MRAVLAQHFFAEHDAGAIHEALDGAEGLERRRKRGTRARLVGDIGSHEACALAQCTGERTAVLLVHVGEQHASALRDEHARSRRTQPGSTARHYKAAALHVHRNCSLLAASRPYLA